MTRMRTEGKCIAYLLFLSVGSTLLHNCLV